MKKKRVVLKRWVEVVLLLINIVCIFIMGSDTDNTKVFIISHIAAMSVFVLSGYIFYKYSRLVEV